MFSHKQNKTHSTSKLIKLLTRRASTSTLKSKNGVFSDWPGQNKPSLMNATYFIKNLVNNKNKEQSQRVTQKLKKQAASFSTCTTIQFCPQNKLTKVTATPQTMEKQTLNQTIDQNYIQEQDYGQVQMNCRYAQEQNINEIESIGNGKKFRREVKTAFVTRYIIQDQEDKNQIQTKGKQNIFRKTKSAARSKNNKYDLTKLKHNTSNLNQSNISTIVSHRFQGQQYQYQQPMRLKDYETNFQAYKLMSKIIDQQMKWEPKRKRPKTSIKFRSYKY